MVESRVFTIGLIAENLASDYTQDLIKTVYDAVVEFGNIRLIAITGKPNDEEDAILNKGDYRTTYNSVYNLGAICDFDGYLVEMGSFRNMPDEERDEYLGRFGNKPMVFISTDVPGGIMVRYDNETGIREAVDLLVKIGGITQIAMLGGWDENYDAVERRDILKECLKEKNLAFPDSAFVSTNMTMDCEDEAEKLLDDNPDVEAIFCVNDAVAVALYAVMKRRGLVPGKDIKIFGFDNTPMSGEMEPPLASIGPKGMTVGKTALEILMALIEGQDVESVYIPTKLFLRASFDYEKYDLSGFEVISMDEKAIYRLFDECFYRYQNATYSREDVNLRRLFYEIMSRIINALKCRYMSNEEFDQIGKMIDIFIENGAMLYTDTQRLMRVVKRLQTAINIRQKSVAANVMVNRLFLRIKDRIILSLAQQKEITNRKLYEDSNRIRDYILGSFDPIVSASQTVDVSVRMLDRLGISNLVLYMYDDPVEYYPERRDFPDNLNMCCMIKEGEMYILSPGRQRGSVESIFIRDELSSICKGYVAFPVFCGKLIFGILACEITDDIFHTGELVSVELGRALYVNRLVQENG